MDSLLFLAYRKKLRPSLVCYSAEPRLHSFVDMVLIDGQASTTFCAYLRSRDASSVSFTAPQHENPLERSGCSAGNDPLSRLVDFINVHTQMPGNQNIAEMAL